MFCLRCSTQMKRGALKGILADFCPKCKSFWLDKGELEGIRRGKKKDQATLKKEARKEKKYEPVVGVANVCPRCFGNLATYMEESVRLDRCTRCEGIFFDRGELDRCLEQKNTTFMKKIIGLLKGE